MKVNDVSKVGPVREVSGGEKSERLSRPADRVSTEQSRKIEAAAQQAQAQSSVERAARIKELAEQVKKGQYVANPQQVADRILESAELAARLRSLL